MSHTYIEMVQFKAKLFESYNFNEKNVHSSKQQNLRWNALESEPQYLTSSSLPYPLLNKTTLYIRVEENTDHNLSKFKYLQSPLIESVYY